MPLRHVSSVLIVNIGAVHSNSPWQRQWPLHTDADEGGKLRWIKQQFEFRVYLMIIQGKNIWLTIKTKAFMLP